MVDHFGSFLEKSKSVIILLPLKPYLDQVAAGLSLYLALREEKEVQIYSPSPMIVEFNRLVGIDKVSSELGNKNLTIEFAEYKATDIERVSYDIKDGQFKLTVIPKQNVVPPQKDSVKLSYSGINVDAVVMIGGLNESHFPAISGSELLGATIAHVGNKDISLSSGKNYISFSKPASSVSEVMYGLIKESGLKIDEDIATNLISGIEKSTNNLLDSGVSSETFMVMSDLIKSGGKRPEPIQYPKPVESPIRFQPRVQNDVNQARTIFTTPDESSKIGGGNDKSGAPGDWLKPKVFQGTSIK